MARLQFNSGKISDVPVSGIHQASYNSQTTFLELKVDKESALFCVELQQG